MALIKCTECGKEISDKAKACPNCGCPVEAEKPAVQEQSEVKEHKHDEDMEKESKGKKEKKPSSKKTVIIVGVIISVAIIGCVIYFVLTADSRKYKSANDLYASGKYEDALKKFSELRGYEDSKEMSEKCKYELSVDGKFIKALKNGLIARWDYGDFEYKEDYDKEVKELDNSEYMKYIEKCVNKELKEISSFKSETFNDEELGKDAASYIDILTQSLDAINYYTMDFNKYSIMWSDVYSQRVILIRKFVDEYGLKVDKKHQDNLDELITNASIADEQNELKAAIDQMVATFTYEAIDSGYGNISYIVNMENTTDVTFEYFGCSVDVLDAIGTIIYTGYTGEIKDFSPGQKAQLETYTGVQGTSIQFHPNYYVKQ